jgi:glycine/D-amino acid oxidase-like deaminating enzyme
MDLRTGSPVWLLKNGLIANYPALARDEEADVAILGAGITGALTAYRLAKAGASLVVLDGRDVGTGSTCASTGLLLHETDLSLVELSEKVGEAAAVRAYALGLQAVDTIEALGAEIGDAAGFERRPSLYLASARRDEAALVGEHALRRKHGFDVDLLTAGELWRRFNLKAPAALLSTGNAQIDAYRFTHALLAAASRKGARIFDRTRVNDAKTSEDLVTLRTERGPSVRAGRMIWATGYEATEQLRRHGGKLQSTWVTATEPVVDLGPWAHRAMIWETARPYTYARITDDGRALVGGEDEAWSSRHQHPRLLAKKSARLMKNLARWFPDLEPEVAYAWAGVFGATADGLPNIGPAADLPHAWIALGYGGNGITFSTIAADILTGQWTGHPHPDAAIFDVERRRWRTRNPSTA